MLPPTVQQAGGDAEAFVETEFDATQPYVQQAVGMAVRLAWDPLSDGRNLAVFEPAAT